MGIVGDGELRVREGGTYVNGLCGGGVQMMARQSNDYMVTQGCLHAKVCPQNMAGNIEPE